MIIMNPKDKGEQTELLVMYLVKKLNISISIPWGDNLRYDQIWDVNGKLLKIQIKTCRVVNKGTVLKIPCKSTNRINGKSIRLPYNKDEIDAIVTAYDNKIYYIPVSDITSTEKTLRLTPPINKQNVGVCYAEDYTIENQLGMLIAE